MIRRLVLVGAGHAHLHVLRELARRPIADAEIVLVSPEEQYYSGMVPGFLQGQYEAIDLRFDVRALAARAGVRFIPSLADRVEVKDGTVVAGVERIPFDVCSLDVGCAPAGADLPGVAEHALALRPMERAVELRRRVDDLLAAARHPVSLIVVGGGAAGTEVAFALERRLRESAHGGTVTIVEGESDVLPDVEPSVRRLARRLLHERGICLSLGGRVTSVAARSVSLDYGAMMPADLVVWTTGPAAPAILSASDVVRDEKGYLLVDRRLRAVDGAPVWGAGDCVTLRDHPRTPKAGVYAVREAPVLERALRAALGRGRATSYRPQRTFLALLNTGDGKAILRWRGVHIHSRLAWWLKDRIDRRFVRRFRCDEKSDPAS